jgi:5-(carboxyamino)imidazole ribonucleotide mutase
MSPTEGTEGNSGAASVAIVMGSSSDMGVMSDAVEVLDRFGIPHQVRVLSAHRTPDDTIAFGRAAAGRGV